MSGQIEGSVVRLTGMLFGKTSQTRTPAPETQTPTVIAHRSRRFLRELTGFVVHRDVSALPCGSDQSRLLAKRRRQARKREARLVRARLPTQTETMAREHRVGRI